jgi:hypothetical protein
MGIESSFPRGKRPGPEADHSQLVVRSIIHGSIHPFPHASSWRSAELIKHRDSFTFMLYYKTLKNGGARNVRT